MALNLDRIFNALSPVTSGAEQIVYVVGRLPRFPGYLVGRDSNNKACILVSNDSESGGRHAPIRLENLEVEFEVRSRITDVNRSSEGIFTIIRCRSEQPEVIRYFFSVGETIIRILGSRPTRNDISSAVGHLIRIFQQLLTPPARSVTGLFGELMLIRQSSNPVRVVEYWRLKDASRFDFTAGDLRIDVKTTSGRSRVHTFSHDQCNPPPSTIAVVASLFAEVTPTGIALSELTDEIESFISGRTELVLKFRDAVAATLGSSLPAAMRMRFDERLAVSSLRLFDLRSVPALRGALPLGVTEVHFRSDLSNCVDIDVNAFAETAPALEDFLSLP